MGTSKLSGKPDEMLGGYLRWTSIPSRRMSLHATETGISSGSCASQARDLTPFVSYRSFVDCPTATAVISGLSRRCSFQTCRIQICLQSQRVYSMPRYSGGFHDGRRLRDVLKIRHVTKTYHGFWNSFLFISDLMYFHELKVQNYNFQLFFSVLRAFVHLLPGA